MGLIENLREAMSEYDGSNESDGVKDARRALQDELSRRQAISGLSKALGAAGAATAADSWSLGPAAGVAGTILGGGLAGLMGYTDYNDAKNHEYEMDELRNNLQREAAKQWTDYKNDVIESHTGKTAGDWAREGLMIDDNGNFNYIDYDYYNTLPDEKLKQIFGEDGMKYIRHRTGENIKNAYNEWEQWNRLVRLNNGKNPDGPDEIPDRSEIII